ncbi:unnamed protein product [Notodromas monacha]|uniref:Uncharacterized protein n=1 Tax=Notodromas monacha TaxID=399045 RepID=A0A7R9BIU3_9CRUS|nr:unnamed protein product [Notodromas monacha]CAG0914727.1 unnamed protein product [Notodromas monacha]
MFSCHYSCRKCSESSSIIIENDDLFEQWARLRKSIEPADCRDDDERAISVGSDVKHRRHSKKHRKEKREHSELKRKHLKTESVSKDVDVDLVPAKKPKKFSPCSEKFSSMKKVNDDMLMKFSPAAPGNAKFLPKIPKIKPKLTQDPGNGIFRGREEGLRVLNNKIFLFTASGKQLSSTSKDVKPTVIPRAYHKASKDVKPRLEGCFIYLLRDRLLIARGLKYVFIPDGRNKFSKPIHSGQGTFRPGPRDPRRLLQPRSVTANTCSPRPPHHSSWGQHPVPKIEKSSVEPVVKPERSRAAEYLNAKALKNEIRISAESGSARPKPLIGNVVVEGSEEVKSPEYENRIPILIGGSCRMEPNPVDPTINYSNIIPLAGLDRGLVEGVAVESETLRSPNYKSVDPVETRRSSTLVQRPRPPDAHSVRSPRYESHDPVDTGRSSSVASQRPDPAITKSENISRDSDNIRPVGRLDLVRSSVCESAKSPKYEHRSPIDTGSGSSGALPKPKPPDASSTQSNLIVLTRSTQSDVLVRNVDNKNRPLGSQGMDERSSRNLASRPWDVDATFRKTNGRLNDERRDRVDAQYDKSDGRRHSKPERFSPGRFDPTTRRSPSTHETSARSSPSEGRPEVARDVRHDSGSGRRFEHGRDSVSTRRDNWPNPAPFKRASMSIYARTPAKSSSMRREPDPPKPVPGFLYHPKFKPVETPNSEVSVIDVTRNQRSAPSNEDMLRLVRGNESPREGRTGNTAKAPLLEIRSPLLRVPNKSVMDESISRVPRLETNRRNVDADVRAVPGQAGGGGPPPLLTVPPLRDPSPTTAEDESRQCGSGPAGAVSSLAQHFEKLIEEEEEDPVSLAEIFSGLMDEDNV